MLQKGGDDPVQAPRFRGDPGPLPALAFTCNICGDANSAYPLELERQTPTCRGCGSTVRQRSVVHALSLGLFGQSLALHDFPSRPELTGIGLSDWPVYADQLASKFAYRNTFFDAEPWLDITAAPSELDGTLDFLISSDVFEHILPPVERGFESSLRLLKPGGLLILTVPYTLREDTDEHFPNLHQHELVEFRGRFILLNRTVDRRWEVFEELVFHGEYGSFLEMRVFSEKSLLNHLRAAGFEQISVRREACLEFGIVWLKPIGRPILARRPKP
jgi:SAM-dependent methyltransferase